MSGQDIALSVEKRTVEGKAVKHLRKDGMVPAVIHNHGAESQIVMVPYSVISKVYKEAGKHHPLAITYGKETYTAMIKDVDFEPKQHKLRHVVFNAINLDEKVETEVPITIEGDIPAEKTGLMVIHQLDHVTIEALPKDLIDEIKVDASKLVEIGDKIFVSDITVPSGVTILTEAEHPIATVEETRAQMSEEAEEETVAEGEETTTAEAKEASEEE